MSEFTPEGIVIDRFPEIKQKLGDDLKLRLGDDAEVDSPEALIGGMNDVFSSAVDGQNGMVQGVVDAFNPATARGVFLSNIVVLNGIKRNEAAYSVCSVDCTAGTAPASIPEGSIVTDVDEAFLWATDAALELQAGETKAVSVTAAEPGSILAPVNTLVKIKTPEYSWESVTNPLSSTVGQVEESDPRLRRRRDQASKAKSDSSQPAIKRNIDAIPSVESSQVYFNKTDAVDGFGNPPGSLWVIVKGGTDAELAEVLAESVAGGTIFIGSQTVIYTDPSNDEDYTVKFSRPTEIPTIINLVLKVNSLFPDDGVAQVKKQIVDYYNGDFTIDGRDVEGFGVGDDVVYSRLYSPVNSVPGHEITTLGVARLGDALGVTTLPMNIYEQGVISDANITIALTS